MSTISGSGAAAAMGSATAVAAGAAAGGAGGGASVGGASGATGAALTGDSGCSDVGDVVKLPGPPLLGLPPITRGRTAACASYHAMRAGPTGPGSRRPASLEAGLCSRSPGGGLFSTPSCPGSIVGAAAFHFRVRDGNGWCHRALTTRTVQYAACPAGEQDPPPPARRRTGRWPSPPASAPVATGRTSPRRAPAPRRRSPTTDTPRAPHRGDARAARRGRPRSTVAAPSTGTRRPGRDLTSPGRTARPGGISPRIRVGVGAPSRAADSPPSRGRRAPDAETGGAVAPPVVLIW